MHARMSRNVDEKFWETMQTNHILHVHIQMRCRWDNMKHSKPQPPNTQHHEFVHYISVFFVQPNYWATFAVQANRWSVVQYFAVPVLQALRNDSATNCIAANGQAMPITQQQAGKHSFWQFASKTCADDIRRQLIKKLQQKSIKHTYMIIHSPFTDTFLVQEIYEKLPSHQIQGLDIIYC